MEAAGVDRADVHCRAFSNRLQAFEDLDLRGVVGGLFYHLFRDLSACFGALSQPIPKDGPSMRRVFINVRRPVSMEKTDLRGRGLFGVDILNTVARSFLTPHS